MELPDEEKLEEVFDKPYHKVLDDMAGRIDPRESRRVAGSRGGLGKLIDIGILLRRGFQESWQFVVVIQALFVFLGLSPQVSEALAQLGIQISGFWLGVIAVGGIVFFFIFGLAMLLYGGSKRSTFLVNQSQNPAQRQDWLFYKLASKKLEKIDKRLDELEEKVET